MLGVGQRVHRLVSVVLNVELRYKDVIYTQHWVVALALQALEGPVY